MNPLYKAKTDSLGFTLIEVIAVLVVICIVAVVAVSRSVNHDTEVYSGADTLKAHLRYAQTMAMNTNQSSGTSVAGTSVWGISATAGSYWLFQGTDSTATANYIRPPEEDTYINSDRTINLTTKKIKLAGAFTIYFDGHGIPYSAYTSSTVNTPLASTLTINVQPLNSNTPNVAITITPQTGYIP